MLLLALLLLLLVLELMLVLIFVLAGVLKEPRWWLVAAEPKRSWEHPLPRQSHFPLLQGCPPLDEVG